MTYSDVGGCKEQIEKLREVVETPLLHVRYCITCLMTQVLDPPWGKWAGLYYMHTNIIIYFTKVCKF